MVIIDNFCQNFIKIIFEVIAMEKMVQFFGPPCNTIHRTVTDNRLHNYVMVINKPQTQKLIIKT